MTGATFAAGSDAGEAEASYLSLLSEFAMPGGYTPSYEFGVPNPGVGDNPENPTGIPWEPAPTTSHVDSWRFYGTDEFPFLRKFPSAVGQGRSELHVRFKGKDGGGPSASYAYFFQSPEAGRNVLDKLRGSPHPFKDVVKAVLIDGRIPYTKISGTDG